MHPDSGADEGMILIWDAETGKQEQLLTTGMNDYRLWTVAWSPDEPVFQWQPLYIHSR